MDIRGNYARSKAQYDWLCQQVRELGLEEALEFAWFSTWIGAPTAIQRLVDHTVIGGEAGLSFFIILIELGF
jgi:hypothetical protein